MVLLKNTRSCYMDIIFCTDFIYTKDGNGEN